MTLTDTILARLIQRFEANGYPLEVVRAVDQGIDLHTAIMTYAYRTLQ